MFVVVSTIVVWEVFIFLLAMSFGLFDIKVFKIKKVEIQLGLSIIMVVVMLINYIVAQIYETTVHANDSYYDIPWYEQTSLIKIYLAFFVMTLGLSIYKYRVYKKGAAVEEIFLTSREYELHKEFDLTLNDYIYMPNVKVYATYGEQYILFPYQIPVQEVDGTFSLRKIKENCYECVSYVESGNDKTLAGTISKISSWMLFISSLVFAILVHGILTFEDSAYLEAMMLLMKSCGFFMFGCIALKLFMRTKSIISFIEIAIGAFAVAASFKFLIDFIAMVF